MKESKTINNIIDDYLDEDIKFCVKEIGDSDCILIEGNSKSLRFLGSIIIALADGHESDFHFSPTGGGCSYFNKKSTKGIYINKKD